MNFERSGEIKQNTASQNTEALSKLQQYINPITLHGKETDLCVENNVWLAPLAGVTDLPFRLVCKNSPYSPGLVFSEMISAKGVHYKGNNSMRWQIPTLKKHLFPCKFLEVSRKSWQNVPLFSKAEA